MLQPFDEALALRAQAQECKLAQRFLKVRTIYRG